jgi:transcription elongation factor GreA
MSRTDDPFLIASSSTPASLGSSADGGLTLTTTDYNELVRELELRRGAYRTELAERLRDARAFGSPGDDDERLAALEDVTIVHARVAQLERLLAQVTVVDEARGDDDVARSGSSVEIEDDDGRTVEYELVGRRAADALPGQITLRSPVGEALLGARPGDTVTVRLPSGRARVLRVLSVTARAASPAREGDS